MLEFRWQAHSPHLRFVRLWNWLSCIFAVFPVLQAHHLSFFVWIKHCFWFDLGQFALAAIMVLVFLSPALCTCFL